MTQKYDNVIPAEGFHEFFAEYHFEVPDVYDSEGLLMPYSDRSDCEERTLSNPELS